MCRLDDSTTKQIFESMAPESPFWLEPGDLLIQRANSLEHVGTAAVFNGPAKRFIYPDLMMRVRIEQTLADTTFVARYLSLSVVRQWLRDRATGTAGNMPKVNGSTVRAVPIAVPPLAEQRRIVAQLEDLLTHGRRAKEALDAIPPLLETLRRSILAAALRGDLTAKWREKHPDVEPADRLLARIRVERRKKWEEAELARLRAKGKPPTDERWKEKYREPEPVDASELPELPEGWAWATIEELTSAARTIVYGIIKAGPDFPGGVPYVRVTEVAAGRIKLDELPRCDPERAKLFERSRLAVGDLLVSKDGTIGKVAFVPPELEGGNINQHVLRVCPADGVDRSFLAWMIEAPPSQAFMTGETRGMALQGVNVEDFRRMPIPVASTAEQLVIAQAVQQQFDQLRRVAEQTRAGRAQADQLEAAVLGTAFRGELVPQDPNDEPAEVLLARLKATTALAEQAGAARAPKKRRGA